MGAGLGFIVPGGGLLGMALGGMLGGSIGGMFGSARQQHKEQKKLEELQKFQQGQLLTKLKADNEQLFSTVKSATAQTSGAMGAVY